MSCEHTHKDDGEDALCIDCYHTKKKKEEFNLSDNIIDGKSFTYIDTEIIREFIRLLKEEMRKELNESFGKSNWINWHEEIIDKLAGEKLI